MKPSANHQSFGLWSASHTLPIHQIRGLIEGLTVALVVSLGLVLSGCAPSSDQSDSGDASLAENKPRIALIMKSLANEFFATMAAGAEAHHADNLERYHLVVNGIKDERDLARQVALVEEMVASGVDAIVIAPADSKALIPVLAKASRAGVAIVNIDNKLDDTILAERDLVIPFVGPDNRTGAKVVGDYLAARLNSGDQVLILEGTRTSFNAQQRLLGFQDAMRTSSITIADSQSANWEMAQANALAPSMLTAYPQARGILAANDNMALGAVAAVRAAGRDQGDNAVMVIGFDNISAVQDAILAGRILATADQHADQLAAYGLEFALELLVQRGTAGNRDSLEDSLQDRETPVDLITIDSLRAN